MGEAALKEEQERDVALKGWLDHCRASQKCW